MERVNAMCKRFADEAFAAYPMRTARGKFRRQWVRRQDQQARPRYRRRVAVMWAYFLQLFDKVPL
jgi:hypothetical protein